MLMKLIKHIYIYIYIIGVRNNKGDSHGKTRAFFYLHSVCGSTDEGDSYSRRADDYTILHSAIEGEFMDLASWIIQKYEKLVHSVNEKGYTTLDLLASKPAAFLNGLSVDLQLDDGFRGEVDMEYEGMILELPYISSAYTVDTEKDAKILFSTKQRVDLND
ncbi:hypothetical protein FEM48_ZijujUnG0123800 [Ziziphus jujuba var. spinosa]|uniref:Uncharacterized protein n=1 Tax=Ziziphus jujuba var. spinosa TaxID=714518 RepID=A0A978U7T1_ZIZJJ|nr:hypothetical protein FEM48_ZijujUnG0123800 [Ziziphus jujuba var. spinosa]